MRCPVCKADNVQGPQCRRCKADLALLFTLEEQRRGTLAEAQRCLRLGQWRDALQHAEMVDWLRSDDDSRRLLAIAHLFERDFAAAWRWYQVIAAKTRFPNPASRERKRPEEAPSGRSNPL